MKIAIIHDELMRRGGGEQVALCFHKAFPDAPLYTSVYQPNNTYPEFKKVNIITSWYQKIVKSEKLMKWFFFPIGMWAMKQLKVEGFDVVLISTTYSGKFIKIAPNTLVITYCYTPFRLAWNPTSYSEYNNSKGLYRWLFNKAVYALKTKDLQNSIRTDFFLAMTEETRDRIIDAYSPKNKIIKIPPPVNIANFYISECIGDYYLVVSRLEFYKKVDLVIDTFNKLGYKLIIVGNGSKKGELMKRANDNITFLQGVDSVSLSKLYAECKALIFPQHEDYGITPLEANASGRPVIAYGAGGVLETMIPYKGNSKQATAIFFRKQEVSNLVEAVKLSEQLFFDPHFIRNNAEKFQESLFIEKIKTFVKDKLEESQQI